LLEPGTSFVNMALFRRPAGTSDEKAALSGGSFLSFILTHQRCKCFAIYVKESLEPCAARDVFNREARPPRMGSVRAAVGSPSGAPSAAGALRRFTVNGSAAEGLTSLDAVPARGKKNA
jgi:hypothetical protein